MGYVLVKFENTDISGAGFGNGMGTVRAFRC
jgi:hypothetical protein